MPDNVVSISSTPISRRTILAGASALAATSILPGVLKAADKPAVVTSIRSLTNPFHADWKAGAEAFAKSVGAESIVLVTEGNSEKGMADIRAVIARTGGNMVLNVDPNDTPDARPIVEECAKAGVYVVIQANKPGDLRPWDFDPYFVSFIGFDGLWSGSSTAEVLFEAMGGSGQFVALGGNVSNTPAVERRIGLENTIKKYPGIEMLDFQVANWKANEAFDATSGMLTRFGDKIKGIWAANDDMGIGALEALRAEGLAGQVPITGVDGIKAAVEAVRSGEFAGTISWDPYWHGGIGLSIGYAAKTGVIDPVKEPKLHREFYGAGILVTPENVEEFYKKNIESSPDIDWSNLWGRVAGPVREG